MSAEATLKLRHVARIENFSNHLDDVGSIDSVFGSEDDRYKFFVEVYPNDQYDQNEPKQVSIYFWLAICEMNNVVAKVSASIVDPEGKQLNCMQTRNKHNFAQYGYGKGFANFISQNFLIDPANNLLNNNTLTLNCEIEIYPDESGVEVKSATTFFHWPIENFRTYLTDEPKENRNIESSTFSLVNNEKFQFRLELHTNGFGEEQKNHLTVALRLVASDNAQRKNKITYSLSVIDWMGKKRNYSKYRNIELGHGRALSIPKFATHEHLLSIMDSSDTLALLCQIDPIENAVSVSHSYELANSQINNSIVALGNESYQMGNVQLEQLSHHSSSSQLTLSNTNLSNVVVVRRSTSFQIEKLTIKQRLSDFMKKFSDNNYLLFGYRALWAGCLFRIIILQIRKK